MSRTSCKNYDIKKIEQGKFLKIRNFEIRTVHENLKQLLYICTYIIKPGKYYFSASLIFSALSFKRKGAKEATFLEVKLFTWWHISNWVRDSIYRA